MTYHDTYFGCANFMSKEVGYLSNETIKCLKEFIDIISVDFSCHFLRKI